MTTTNEVRSHVMAIAWGLYQQAEEDGDRRYTFAQALAGAWRFSKRAVAAAPKHQVERRADASFTRHPTTLPTSINDRRREADQAWRGA